MRILTFCEYYLPGYKAGGPIKTILNMVEQLGDEFQFSIITRDRDSGDLSSYSDVIINCWQKVGKAEVLYLNPKQRKLNNLRNILNSNTYDLIYLNSFFSPFTRNILLLRNLGFIPNTPIIIAPRGEFSKGALNIKRYKKYPYIKLANLWGLYHHLTWQVSSEYEKNELLHWISAKLIIVAADLPSVPSHISQTQVRHSKSIETLHIVFLSRISRMKNLDYALSQLQRIKGTVRFHIYGPLEDKKYWLECQQIIKKLPDNITVEYMGTVKPNQVLNIFSQYHLFFLPTLGENFGHVILEALTVGCPVLISDRTAWKGLEKKGIGWDVPLEHPEQFQNILHQCSNMDEKTFSKLSHCAYTFAQKYLNDDTVIEQNRALFQNAIFRKSSQK